MVIGILLKNMKENGENMIKQKIGEKCIIVLDYTRAITKEYTRDSGVWAIGDMVYDPFTKSQGKVLLVEGNKILVEALTECEWEETSIQNLELWSKVSAVVTDFISPLGWKDGEYCGK